MSKFGGYNISEEATVFVDFLARAREAYTALELAIAPVDAKIAKLQADWTLRPMNFWHPILETSLPAIKGACASCSGVFHPGEEAIPLIMLSSRWSHIVNIQHVGSLIEECGIVLTAHVYSTDQARSLEGQIRARQRLMGKLQDLSTAVHTTINDGRRQLDVLPAPQGGTTHE